MRQPFELNAGLWWRFDRYAIRRGIIGPAPGARLSLYDPWVDAYRDDRADPPYRALLDLAKPVAGQNRNRAIESWCSQNGLLGILLQRVHVVTLAARWERPLPTQTLSAEEKESLRAALAHLGITRSQGRRPGKGQPLLPVLRQYVRIPGGWATIVSEDVKVPAVRVPPETLLGDPVTAAQRPPEWPLPGLVAQDTDGVPATEAFSDFARFFPSVQRRSAELFQYPAPTSRQFWDIYAEPVDDFVAAVRQLARAIRWCRLPRSTGSDSEKQLWEARSALHTLRGLLAPSCLVPIVDANQVLHLRWHAPSLLGTLAIMATQDLVAKRLIGCAACGTPILSAAPGTKFCSERCQHRVQKRAQRQRRRAGD